MSNIFDLQEFRSITLRTEDEIISTWKQNIQEPKVSILCNTYNHKPYIEDALRGFIIQKTTFPFEVILHDDASTDGTTDIVREFAARYPRIVRPIIQVENQYSKGIKPSLLSFSHSQGKYIAMCEGDDFWLSPNKLAHQFDALEREKDVNLSFHPAYTLDVNSGRIGFIGRHFKAARHISAIKILNGGGGYCPTASLFFRRTIFNRLGDWFDQAPFGDLFLQAISAEHGGAAYLSEVAAVYRTGDAGSWSSRIEKRDEMQSYRARIDKAMVGLSSEMGPNFRVAIIQLRSKQYCMLASRFLKCGEYREFKSLIEESWALYPWSSWRQWVLYLLRHFRHAVIFLPKLHHYFKKIQRIRITNK